MSIHEPGSELIRPPEKGNSHKLNSARADILPETMGVAAGWGTGYPIQGKTSVSLLAGFCWFPNVAIGFWYLFVTLTNTGKSWKSPFSVLGIHLYRLWDYTRFWYPHGARKLSGRQRTHQD